MAITTKTGDKGKTSLYQGRRVSKDSLRVETYGALDELCSYLGLAKSLLKAEKEKNIIESIQKDLFVIGAEVGSETRFLAKLKKRIIKSDIERLEIIIKDLEPKKSLKECCFCLSGQSTASAVLDITRAIARKLERRAATLLRKKIIKNNYIFIYLNRVSDLLFLLARSQEKNPRKLK